MFDRHLRAMAAPLERAIARPLVRAGFTGDRLTALGLVVGLGACVAAGFARWWLALALWLLNRAVDGVDGHVARARDGEHERGGFLDVMADFVVYGGFVVGVAVALPEARLACAVLLATYYVNGSAFLALSSLAERRARERPDERSLHFVGGLAEGGETILVHSLFCLFPQRAAPIAWGFAVAVGITALQRIVWGMRVLRAG
ncbi:MAG: CDP-alcohol phosphatidyltransferase family protein [Actinobacteria bacterium]|nr:CDP-alcohol phosphatidyltransferase family protein [Actinomycetota bacterium]